MATNYKKLKSDLQKQGRMTLFVPHNEDLPCIGFEPTWSKTKILKVLLQFNDIKSNIKSMELEEGADDQYYDYSPSQVEAIIYAIPQLTPEHQDYTIEGLKTHLRNFIANEENDEDMISQYSDTLESLEKYESDHRETELFSNLYISETINKL